MKVRLSVPFTRQYQKLPLSVRKKVDRQIQFLSLDLRHPGAHAKHMVGKGDLWEARVDIHHRLTFAVVGGTLVFRKVGSHDILRQP